MSIVKKMTVGIDWISATKIIDTDAPGSLYLIYRRITDKETTRRMRLFGFDGLYFKDECCGHLFYGENHRLVPPREYLQMGGQLADLWWLQVFNSISHITRIDVRVDITLFSPMPTLAEICYVNLAGVAGTGKSRIKKYNLVSSKSGETLYVGSRMSSTYGRLYDKSGQMTKGEERGLTWRYEVEAKEHHAGQLAIQLAELFNSGRSRDGLKAIARFVYDWFDERGVSPIFDLSAEYVSRIELISETHYGDKMTWLRQQVSPSVRKMCARGYGEEVIKALGLTDYIESLGIQQKLPNVDKNLTKCC